MEKRKKLLLVLLLCCLFLTGCQLPLANYFRDRVFPQDMTPKIALSPLLLPGYVLLSIVDITIINPINGIKNIPSTTSSIWSWEEKTPWLGYGVLLLPKLVAIPPAAVGTSMFSEQFQYQKKN